MQGYLFSAAKPAAEIRQLLFSHRERPAAVNMSQERKRRQIPNTANV
jgi:hypothetical protein